MTGNSGDSGDVTVRCYAELNDALPPERRQRDVRLAVDGPTAAGELIARLGLAVEQVELILCDGTPFVPSALVRPGARLSLYPMFERFDVSALLGPDRWPMRRPRFVADAHLGKLARRLRLLGLDTLYANDFGDDVLAGIVRSESRILLTRDVALLRRPEVTHGLFVPQASVDAQVRGLVERLHLDGVLDPFSRCTVCNGLLARVPLADVEGEVPAGVRSRRQAFRRCAGCRRIYWEGTHYQRMLLFVRDVKSDRHRCEDGDPQIDGDAERA